VIIPAGHTLSSHCSPLRQSLSAVQVSGTHWLRGCAQSQVGSFAGQAQVIGPGSQREPEGQSLSLWQVFCAGWQVSTIAQSHA
jgi:hypothetical protein